MKQRLPKEPAAAWNPSALMLSADRHLLEGHLDTAETLCRRVLATDPSYADAHRILFHCLLRKNHLDQAEQLLDGAMKDDPSDSMARNLRLQFLMRKGDFSGLQEEVEHRLSTDYSHYSHLSKEYERSHFSLLLGQMSEGWQQYEARWQAPGLIGPERHFEQPRWTGESFVGQTLLLHWEQGLGDTLMFVRYAPMVKALGGRVLLAAQVPLAGLLTTCPGVDEIIPHGAPFPPFDLHLHLLSLPWIFRTNLETIPAETPYLDVPEHVPNRQRIAKTLVLSEGSTRIGIAWAGSAGHKNDAIRSIPPVLLKPLAGLTDVAWYSFQLGVGDQSFLPGMLILDPMLRNFSDTAYALSGMDLVITVDTALAHLAGAMGIPTLLLVAFFPDWRWMLGREDSPWYPSMHIYRQPNPGDWETVIQQVIRDLSGES